ncbi:hypothetical protein BU26DRAFT_108618 [Trematosphaeria pertusa]|uniref:Uncharacterized protein n=1 Tax=Trematosphaeria pertusa TaxID=390896 RepID=A0A6A6HZU1_9PLEO|nr:uncharacterized protein BU26DRAFT_108618 [Trematosphaeria pertusa]KAF2243754.1 hypothetical protein BU26DRAFT_108618 [Trematosphaeria pertusa]
MFYYLSSHDGCMALPEASKRMHRHSVRRHWLLRCSAFMMVGFCPTFAGFGIGMASRNYNTLIFSFEVVFGLGGLRCFHQVSRHHLSSSSSWPSYKDGFPNCSPA